MTSVEYPNLFKEADIGAGICKFALCDTPPPDNLISNVNLVPFIGEQCVVVQMRYPHGVVWEIPGGTLEPGESYLDTIRREVWEEAGALLLTFNLFGAWYCRATLPGPYRPHLPHPNYYRVVGYGEVELVGASQSVEGSECVLSVECLSVEEATMRFHDTGREHIAELYQLAAYIRSTRDNKSRL